MFTLSIDWEDFGQLLCRDHFGIITPPKNSIDRQTKIILDLLDETNQKATFFVLSMLSDYKQDLVKTIKKRGHEIGIHGHNHNRMDHISNDAAREDIRTSIDNVCQIIGKPVYGYRAPYFSINQTNLYVLEYLAEYGIEYDSSIFPMKMPRYGIDNFSPENKLYRLPSGNEIVELPITIFKYGGYKIPMAGGGYMRLLPQFLVNKVYSRLNTDNRSAMIYMHPYEFDSKRINCASNFPDGNDFSKAKLLILNKKWNLQRKSILKKLKYLLKEYEFITCKEKSDYVKNSAYSPTILG